MPETTPDQPELTPDPGLARLNALSEEDLATELAQCLNVDRWVAAVATEAPFPDRGTLLACADRHARGITAEEAATALARHPRIGEKAKGQDTESAWSRGEQSAFTADTDDASARVQRIFAFAQGEYEDRFGQIYLVCASGRTSRELLSDLVERLDNDPSSTSLTSCNLASDEPGQGASIWPKSSRRVRTCRTSAVRCSRPSPTATPAPEASVTCAH